MLLSEAKSNGLFTIRIEFAAAYEEAEQPEIAERWKDAYIVLRELSGEESANLDQNENYLKQMISYLPGCIVDHNFEISEGKKASSADVAKQVLASSTLTAYTIREWAESLPFGKLKGGKSEKQPTS